MTAKQAKPPAESYQVLKARLDGILSQLQADNVDLDAALDLYKQAQVVIAELEKYLEKVSHSFEKIKPTS
jgi:exodeoxyribonuclease VII small subunit